MSAGNLDTDQSNTLKQNKMLQEAQEPAVMVLTFFHQNTSYNWNICAGPVASILTNMASFPDAVSNMGGSAGEGSKLAPHALTYLRNAERSELLLAQTGCWVLQTCYADYVLLL